LVVDCFGFTELKPYLRCGRDPGLMGSEGMLNVEASVLGG
jgi:hypothetical protein